MKSLSISLVVVLFFVVAVNTLGNSQRLTPPLQQDELTATAYAATANAATTTGWPIPPTNTATRTATGTITPAPPTATATATATITGTPFQGPSNIRIIDIRFNPPNDDADLEVVTLQNRGLGGQDLSGWTLQDELGNTYHFPPIYITNSTDIRIWTGHGVNDSGDLFWGLALDMWDNTGDCAYLFNETGILVDQYCYAPQPACSCTYLPSLKK